MELTGRYSPYVLPAIEPILPRTSSTRHRAMVAEENPCGGGDEDASGWRAANGPASGHPTATAGIYRSSVHLLPLSSGPHHILDNDFSSTLR